MREVDTGLDHPIAYASSCPQGLNTNPRHGAYGKRCTWHTLPPQTLLSFSTVIAGVIQVLDRKQCRNQSTFSLTDARHTPAMRTLCWHDFPVSSQLPHRVRQMNCYPLPLCHVLALGWLCSTVVGCNWLAVANTPAEGWSWPRIR